MHVVGIHNKIHDFKASEMAGIHLTLGEVEARLLHTAFDSYITNQQSAISNEV